jgi:hypothetical protein
VPFGMWVVEYEGDLILPGGYIVNGSTSRSMVLAGNNAGRKKLMPEDPGRGGGSIQRGVGGSINPLYVTVKWSQRANDARTPAP